MNKVLCFGEALIDFIPGEPVVSDGLTIPGYGQYPGGAPANAAVAVAKLGGHAAFVGQVGSDAFGRFLASGLARYDVDIRYLKYHPSAKTALAFVHLDEGERSFSFYRDNSADLLYRFDDADSAMFSDAGILHFCSNTLTEPGIAEATLVLLQHAHKAGIQVSFDVNLRHNLWPQGKADTALIEAALAQADIVKFSQDEIGYLTTDVEPYVARLLDKRARLVVLTQDGGAVRYYTAAYSGSVQAPKVQVVDTTAAGDSFIGGLLYQLSLEPDMLAVLADQTRVENMVAFATACGAHTVTRYGAFPAMPVLADIQ